MKAEIVRLTEQVLQAVTDCDYETYVKLVSPELTCFEPPAIGNIVEGLEFHKYFFDNGLSHILYAICPSRSS